MSFSAGRWCRLGMVAIVWLPACLVAFGQEPPPKQEKPPVDAPEAGTKKKPPKPPKKPKLTARQVTLFGIIADPNGEVLDPKLEDVGPQLRKLFPNHAFRLVEVRSQRLMKGESISCDLGDGFVAETSLSNPLDSNGKVQLRVSLALDGMEQIVRDVATPPNQLFFCDKKLPDGTRLLLGVGAR